MKILIIGSGGREHALAWKLAQSPRVEKIYCAPGNPNIREAECIDTDNLEELADFAAVHQIDLTVVGPEAPLCEGIVDLFKDRELPIFGPDSKAALLEGSKNFAKEFMLRHGIPTASYTCCHNRKDALREVQRYPLPVVIKADGLAAGKGVSVATTAAEAEEAVNACFSGEFGSAGETVVVEECLIGEEASIIALTDGRSIIPLVSSQDHKRAGENDTGPNTGGMGAYSPAPVVNSGIWNRVEKEIIQPFLMGCQEEHFDYRGIIYAGVMITENGPKVLEFNVRFGDPETQAILPRLKSDLSEAMQAAVEQRLHEISLEWDNRHAVCVVLAADGYPGKYQKGEVIKGLEKAENAGALIFHAGTGKDSQGQVISNGGRVLGITALGETLPEAIEKAYTAVNAVDWPGAYFRRDIARRGCDQ